MKTNTKRANVKKAIMVLSYYIMVILVPAGLLAKVCWATASFVSDPVPYELSEGVNVPRQSKDIPMKEWVLNEWEKVGQRDNANLIINCESKWRNDTFNVNKNGSVDLGLYQFNTVHFDGFITMKEIGDYKLSTAKAIKLWQKKGWQPWYCSKILLIK